MSVTSDEAVIDGIATHVRSGNFVAARRACDEFLHAVADSYRQAPVRAWLGVVEQKSGSLTAAASQFERALSSRPGTTPWHVQLGLVLAQLGRLDDAEHHYREALNREPTHALARYNLGVLQQSRRQWAEARASFEAALVLRPAFAEALNNLGNTMWELGDFAAAERCFQQALATNPQLPHAHYGIGRGLVRAHRYADARQHYLDAVQCNPAFVDAWLELAECHYQCGQQVEAIACIDQALEHDKDHEAARFKRALYAGEQPAMPPPAMIEQLFDDMADTFDAHLVERLGYAIPALLVEHLQTWLTARPATHGRLATVLDLGCGTGLFGVAVRPYASSLAGVDLSAGMLAKARARGVYDALDQDDLLTWLDHREQPADLIVAADVFVYVGRLDELFSRATNRLSPGGRFAFSVESLNNSKGDYQLLPTSRYAHAAAYIERLAVENRLSILSRVDTAIRSENGIPVAGHVFVLGQD